MKTQVALVEYEDKSQKVVVACSGLMLNNNYVIITANIFPNLVKNVLENQEPGKLHTNLPQWKSISLNVIWKDANIYTVRNATVFAIFVSDHIKNCNRTIFQSWAVDSIDNNNDVPKILSVFFVLALTNEADKEDFKGLLKEWWNASINLDINKGDAVCIKSVPFANRNFVDTLSKGIVSNTFGDSSCLVFSDCPCAPGTEGSPVYPFDGVYLDCDVPVGIVLSSVSFWRGEWVGLTLIADIRPIILELIDLPLVTLNNVPKPLNHKLIATMECSLIQIYSGKGWGTAVLLNDEKGIFITNSHVVENEDLCLYYRGLSFDANCLYKTPDADVFDLAIIQSEPDIVKRLKLRSISISKNECKSGETVYAAGYALFPKESDASPSLSRGCLSQVHPSMIKTTCCIHPGSSGGGILDCNGALLGIIVSNIKVGNNNTMYPRMNMAVPFSAISETIFSFFEKHDPKILNNLHVKNKEAEFVWKRLEGKL